MNAVDASERFNQASSHRPSLLALILDTNPTAWSSLDDLPLPTALSTILLFLNAHLALNHLNRVVVIASHTDRAQILYPSPDDASSTTSKHKTPGSGSGTADDANKYRQFKLVEDTVMSGMKSLLARPPDASAPSAQSCISGALALALSYISKISAAAAGTGATTSLKPTHTLDEAPPPLISRVLVVSVSGDISSQYVPLMSSIFCAQRRKIPLDVLKLAGSTTFLQQASDATGGVYVQVEDRRAMLQYLMMGFLADSVTREHLVRMGGGEVDFRAACFCHKKVVEVGYVCSVCLSIFCEQPAECVCLTCGSKLTPQAGGVVRLQKRKKKKKAGE